ncbi:MAG: hypothetical protein K2O08_00915, partial [Clostridia bacterium]|nr:hypothetical protein [Clostridia bacterium]
DDTVVTYLIFGNDKEIKEISLADNDKAITGLTQRVQPLSLLVHHPDTRKRSVLQSVCFLFLGFFAYFFSFCFAVSSSVSNCFLHQN